MYSLEERIQDVVGLVLVICVVTIIVCFTVLVVAMTLDMIGVT